MFRERPDAGLGDVDDVLAEPGKRVGAGGAGIEDRGDPLGDAVGVGRNPQRGHAVVDVDMDVDQSRRHDRAADVEDMLGVGLGNVGRHLGDGVAEDGDVA